MTNRQIFLHESILNWMEYLQSARMYSQGVPGKIQISKSTYDLIEEEFNCTYWDVMQIKGKGQMETWFLEGSKS